MGSFPLPFTDALAQSSLRSHTEAGDEGARVQMRSTGRGPFAAGALKGGVLRADAMGVPYNPYRQLHDFVWRLHHTAHDRTNQFSVVLGHLHRLLHRVVMGLLECFSAGVSGRSVRDSSCCVSV